MIKLENITVKIETSTILKDINLTLNDNETVLIIGPNGHGKSTIFKTIFKHYSTQIISGNYYINNKLANDYTTDQVAKEKIYLAMQNPVEIPGLKVFDLIRSELALEDEKENAKVSIFDLYKKINKEIDKLNLKQEVLERSVNENFSGGEKKKIEILQMENLNPDFIFLDEIDSGLDADALNIIADKLIQKQQEKKSIVFISHNISLVEKLKPSRVIMIANGQIVKESDIQLAYDIHKKGYKQVLKELNITLTDMKLDDIDLKHTKDTYFCNGKQ